MAGSNDMTDSQNMADIEEELSARREAELTQTEEDLREFYVTPLYLQTMAGRARLWSREHIQYQLQLFRRTMPNYPEVLEILEGELHRRNLNKLRSFARGGSAGQLRSLLRKYGQEPDYREVIETEMEIRKGVRRLHDSSGET